MRAERTRPCPGATVQSDALLRLSIEADSASIRRALDRVRTVLVGLQASEECLGDIELVLAEVLTNIQRHAYGDGPGRIDLEIAPVKGGLVCTLMDRGCPMPDGRLPAGQAVAVDVPSDVLPEGGFGWFLIRSHALALDYSREGGVNCLTLHLPLVAPN